MMSLQLQFMYLILVRSISRVLGTRSVVTDGEMETRVDLRCSPMHVTGDPAVGLSCELDLINHRFRQISSMIDLDERKHSRYI